MADFAEGATRERSVSSAFAKMDLHGVQLERAKEQMAIQSEKCYEDQAIQFLNAYWNEPSMRLAEDVEKREMVYQSCLLMEKLDKKNHKLGNHLDEFESHLFLEKLPYVDAQTAHAMRDALLAIDIDFDKTTSLLEFLIYIFQIKNWPYVATFVGGASAEDLQALEEAKRSLNQATAALEDSKAKSDAHELAAAEAEHEKEQALHEEQLASAAAATAKVAKADLALAKAEAEQALGSLQAEEKKRADAIAAEEAKCADETLSTVKKGRAKAMLKILESEDSQPLRTARITQEAAVRKVDKATKKAAKAAEKSELAATAAAAEAAHAAHAEEESRAAKILADAAVEAADAALTRANAELDKVVERVNAGGDDAVAGQEGSFWWMDRQFEDAKKYMSKKQIAKVEAQMAARNQKRESSRKL